MHDLTIEFTRPRQWSPLSSIIRLIEGTPYSHVRLKWRRCNGSLVIFHASGTNAHFIGESAQAFHSDRVIYSYTVKMTFKQMQQLETLAADWAGIKYGVLQLIGMLFVEAFDLRYNPLSKGIKTQICSELVFRVLTQIMGFGSTMSPDAVSPKDVRNFLNRLATIRPSLVKRGGSL